MTKPKIKLKDRLLQLAVIVASAGLALLVVHQVSFLHQGELFIDDIRVAAGTPQEPQSKDILILGLTEDTLAKFPYRSPVDRAFLTTLLEKMEENGARAVGLDILFDQDTEEDKDDQLKKAIRDVKIPLVISFTDKDEVVNSDQKERLAEYVPLSTQVYADIVKGDDGTIRQIYPGEKLPTGEYRYGFARGLLHKLGGETPDQVLDMVWHGRPDSKSLPFEMREAHFIPILAATQPAVLREAVQGKIVLVGSWESLNDRHRTPFAVVEREKTRASTGDVLDDVANQATRPGIEIIAHQISQLLEGRRAQHLSLVQEFIFILVFAALGGILGGLEIGVAWRVASGAVVLGLLWAGGWYLFNYTHFMVALVSPTIGLAMALWGAESLTGREAKKQREFIQGAFSRYLSPKVVDQLVADPTKLRLEGEQKEMTFLFTDLADFTKFAEKMNSTELATLLNIYLDGMVAVVQSHDGTVDKFIGDAIFAIFNAPLDQEDHCERAVRCALDIDKFSEAFRQENYEKEGYKLGITRVGINTGQAVIGNFGSTKRQEYTALGDAVNTASRLEGVNKQFGTRLCVSQTTYEQCKHVKFRPIAVIAPKGKSEFLPIYEPLSDERAESEFIRGYMDAYGRCERKEDGALQMFDKLFEAEPEDGPTNLHRNRLMANEVGVAFALTEK